MTIWLGYPEETSDNSSGDDPVQTLINEVQALDDNITQLEDQLVTELETSDAELKRNEKEDFIEQAGLAEDGVSVDSTWSEIIEAYNARWRTESGAKRDALEDKLKWIRGIQDEPWSYGDPRTVHGRIAVGMDARIANGNSGEARTKISELAEKMLELNTKMVELSEALEGERNGSGSGGSVGGGGNTNQSILETVRNMREVRISTVTNVVTDDTRWLVEHQIPGRAGTNSEVSSSVLQDLGRRPAKLSFKGLVTAQKENKSDMHKKIETLKWFYKQRKPLYFSSTFVSNLQSTKVVIEKLNFEENIDSPYAVSFNCQLKEYSDVDWRKPQEESQYLARQTRHWADYQALKAMVEYRFRYIEPDETPGTDLVGNRLARFIIGMNGKVKHLAVVGRLVESPKELGVSEVELNVTNLSWNQDVARRGDTLSLTADVSGVVDGTDAKIEIWEYDTDGSHDLITTLTSKVRDNKLSQPWEYEYHEDVDEAPTAEESDKGYNPPEYFFTVEINDQKFGEMQESGLLEFKDFIEISLKDEDGNPLPNEEFILILPDGSEIEGKLDADGYAKVEEVPPGRFTVRFPNI